MSKIIEFGEKLNKLEEIPAGSTFTIIGQIGDQGMLKTKMCFQPQVYQRKK